MRHVEDPASLGAEDVKEPVQRRHGRRRRLGPQGIHDDPGRVREEERARRDDRLRPDAARDTARPGTTSGSPTTTCGSAGPIRIGRWRYLFINLPNIVKDEEPVEQADIVLWCNSAVHHEPRNEDGMPGARPTALAGRRRLGGLGARDVERRGPPPPQPLRPDALLSLPAPAAAPPGQRAAAGPPTARTHGRAGAAAVERRSGRVARSAEVDDPRSQAPRGRARSGCDAERSPDAGSVARSPRPRRNEPTTSPARRAAAATLMFCDQDMPRNTPGSSLRIASIGHRVSG